jgi:hypothetical protein
VVLIAGAAIVQAVFVTNPDGWLTGPGRAFKRGMEVEQVGRGDGRNAFRGLPPDALGRRRANLRNRDLRDMTGERDLDGADFSGADLRGVQLQRSSFNKAKLVGTDLSRGEFDSCRFRQADLTGAKFIGAKLTYADFRGATIIDADFQDADLTGALLHRMTPEDAARVRWRAAICPDGAPADEEHGCIGHEGHIPAEERATYEGRFLIERAWGDRCTRRRERWANAHAHLYFLEAEHVRVAPDRFISKDATLRFDRRGGRVRIVVEDEECQRRVFLRVE